MALETLPSIIANSQFTDDGFVEGSSGLLVPAYVGSQFGFWARGRDILFNDLYPELVKRNVQPLCPFTACGEYIGPFPSDNEPLSAHRAYWSAFNDLVGPVNYETLMPRSKFMIAFLDGGHAIDDGVAAEISFFASNIGPVIGVRSDFRLAENISALINPAVEYFLKAKPYAGVCFFGADAYDNAYKHIGERAQELLRDRAA